ncbi:spermidine synthase [Croceicoccus sp. F390]|uniref:Spermidine synthase n=1 Tax=Croceicoccus esteveae TaxID=3075597 RepID=A0ABU2ZGY1_9SPHN|nr:spermidine synthase [Croceicoccus sp. F390]MDT0575858.1 spermidine synthase [Croceicoccus sp. F390]
MIQRELLDIAEVPGGSPLHLFRHDGDFMITLDRNELMSSRMSGSEQALGRMTCERLGSRAAVRILIGGYGMGYTLRAVLDVAAADATVVVAELVPQIVAWAKGPMQALSQGCLDDPRVTVQIADVAELIRAGTGRYDAICLDVDNGPDGLTRQENDNLYTSRGLASARAALRPGGILAIWSARPDPAFTRLLKKAGFTVDEVQVKARTNGKGPTHTIWFAVPDTHE